MIAKGKSGNHTANLCNYLLDKRDNEAVIFHGSKGTVSQDLRGAVEEMEALAGLTNCDKFFYELSVRPKDGESLTPEQWEKTISAYEKALKLEGHQRAIVEHVKDGTSHFHVVWSRIDPETLKATRMSWNYAKHEEINRALEKEFGLEQVPGRFARDPDQERPGYGHSHKEAELARAAKFNLAAWENEVRGLVAKCTSAKELQAALAERDTILAKGDSVPFMLVDPSGGYHRGAQALGLRVKELKAKLADIDRAALPTVEQAQELSRIKREKITTPEIESTKPRERGEMEAAFRKAYIASRDFETFKEEFTRRGFTLHRADDKSPVIALDREGRIVPLDAATLERGTDPIFRKQIEAARLPSVDQELGRREKEARAGREPVPPIDNGKSVADRLAEMKTEATPQPFKTYRPGYQAPGMVAQQSSARSHHKQRLRLKELLAKRQQQEAELAAKEKLALQRLEAVAAKQITAPPKTPEQIAEAEAKVKAYHANIRAEREKEQAAERVAKEKAALLEQQKAAAQLATQRRAEEQKEQIKAAERAAKEKAERDKAAKETTTRNAPAQEQKTTRPKPGPVQEKAAPLEQQRAAAQQTTQRRAEEQKEQIKAAEPPRPTQAQAAAAHKAATTEQRDGQKRGILDTWTVPSRSGKENAYDYDRE